MHDRRRNYMHNIPAARSLRQSETATELLLWELLRGRRLHGCKFRRQHAIGKYVVDFYCHELRLVVIVAVHRLAPVGGVFEHEFDEAAHEALPPEQKALLHLLRAEATRRQIQVAFGNRGGGGGGGGAGRDLAVVAVADGAARGIDLGRIGDGPAVATSLDLHGIISLIFKPF